MWRKIQDRHVYHREHWEKEPLTSYEQRWVTDIKALP